MRANSAHGDFGPPGAAVETLVGKRSDSYRATEVYRQKFGDHAIVVLAKGDLANLVLTDNLGRLLGLEGCISGNKPKDQAAPGGPRSPCAEFARTKPVKVVYGPGTFINAAAGEIQDQLAARVAATRRRAQLAAGVARREARRRGASRAEVRRYGQEAATEVQRGFQQQLLGLAARYGLTARSASCALPPSWRWNWSLISPTAELMNVPGP